MKARLIGGHADGTVLDVDPTRTGWQHVVTPLDVYRCEPAYESYFLFRSYAFVAETVQESHVQQKYSAELIPVLEPAEAFGRLQGRLHEHLEGRRILSLPIEKRWYDPETFCWVYKVSVLTEVIR